MIRSSRIGLAHALLALFAIAILVKAARVQLVAGEAVAREGRTSADVREEAFPRRAARSSTRRIACSAQSREMVRLEIAPREVREPRSCAARSRSCASIARSIARALGHDREVSRRSRPVPRRRRRAARSRCAASIRSRSLERSYAVSAGRAGHPRSRRRGQQARRRNRAVARFHSPRHARRGDDHSSDSKGQSRESPTAPGTAPTKGNSVVLTINADLQEIAEKALADAVARMGAEGGDIVILDPHDGEILAMASRRLDPRQTSATALTEPFEPGSTLKPFMAAGLLERGLRDRRDSVDTGNGVVRDQRPRDSRRASHRPRAAVPTCFAGRATSAS